MQDIDEGGLKMVDMKSHQNALYLSWVPKLMASNIDKPHLKTLPTLFFSKLGKGLDIFNTCCVDRPYWDAKTCRRILEKCCTNMAET